LATFRVWTRFALRDRALGAAVDSRSGGAVISARVAAHRGGPSMHVAELLEREGAACGQAGIDLTLELDEPFEMWPRGGRRSAQRLRGVKAQR
jgi:hypothetical protein